MIDGVKMLTMLSRHFLPVLKSCSSLLSSLEALAPQPLVTVAEGAPAAAAIAIDNGMVMNCGWFDDDANNGKQFIK